MKRSMVLFALTLVVLLVCAPFGAQASRRTCVSYTITAPVVGTKSDTKCTPVDYPEDWDGYESWSNCDGIPPAGYSRCITVATNLPI